MSAMRLRTTKWLVAGAISAAVHTSSWAMVSVSSSSASRSPNQSAASVEDLRHIGTAVAKAVSDRDIETILRYDRPDLQKADRSALEDRKSDLHCFLFDRSCGTDDRPSVRDILAEAESLGIEVQLLDAPNAATHGLLLFFDAAVVDKRKLEAESYQCELSRRHQLVSWSFKREQNGWVSAHPPFDAETDTLCSP
jgi:hypothetical protein